MKKIINSLNKTKREIMARVYWLKYEKKEIDDIIKKNCKQKLFKLNIFNINDFIQKYEPKFYYNKDLSKTQLNTIEEYNNNLILINNILK